MEYTAISQEGAIDLRERSPHSRENVAHLPEMKPHPRESSEFSREKELDSPDFLFLSFSPPPFSPMRMEFERFATKGCTMPTKYLPSKDGELRGWANRFAQAISSDPLSFGITPEIAATYSDKAAAFDAAYSVATAPPTRGGSTVLRKDQARADLIAYTRLVVRSIQACMIVTVRANPTRIARPDSKPVLMVLTMNARRLKLLASEIATNSLGKPQGVAGISVFYFIGDQPAADAARWTLLTNSSRARIDALLPATVTPGMTVWLAARYFNPRSQAGPSGNPISVTVGAVGVEFKSLAA
jgi:hypothetical protein